MGEKDSYFPIEHFDALGSTVFNKQTIPIKYLMAL